MNKRKYIIVLVIMSIFLVCFYLHNNPSLIEGNLKDIESAHIINNKTGEDIIINNTSEEVIDFIHLLDKIDEKTYLNPKEYERQESDPFYIIELYYVSGTVSKIYSTETGVFFYRMIEDSGNGSWVGGKSESLNRRIEDAFDDI